MSAASSPPVNIQSGRAPAAGATGYGAFLAQLLSDRETFFAEIGAGEGVGAKLGASLVTLVGACALYGAAMGAYASPAQALSAAIKLPLLDLGTIAICFPGFYVVQVLAGSRLRFAQVLAFVLGSIALSAVLMVAAVPVTVFFLLTGANYYFLTLLHVAIVLGAGLVGMLTLHDGLATACEQRGLYPRKALAILRAWAVLFAFVGIQAAWNLQPFVGDRGRPFQLFRHNEGNFYTAVVYSVGQLVGGSGSPAEVARERYGTEPSSETRRSLRGQIDSTRAGAPGR